jgi:hypothetical protein
VFRELLQGQNPLVRTWHVERFLRADPSWTPADTSTARIVARVRNGAPLVVEQTWGQGRVLAFLTTYAPYWNDMVLGPSVIVALRLQAHLGFARRVTDARVVGTEIRVPLSSEQYRQDVRLFLPADDPAVPLVIDRPAERPAADPRQYVASLAPRETLRSGIYELWFSRLDGSLHADRFAVNVDATEGDLAQTSTAELIAHLDPVPVEVSYADQYESALVEPTGFNHSLLLMVLLILLLLAEQALAYFNSYHVARGTRMDHVGRPGHRASVARLREQNEADLDAARSALRSEAEQLPRAEIVRSRSTFAGGESR